MAIILNLKENNNELQFLNTPQSVIICGNDNYQLNIEFSEDWQAFETKTAVFSVNGKNQLIDFSGNTCSVPAMPNAQNLLVYLMTGDMTGKKLVTTPLFIKLVPTANGLSDAQFDKAENYLIQLQQSLLALNKGTLVIGHSETADYSTVAENVSNPNLLINGDFKVNQRGESTYSTTNKYTVDRWKLVSGSVIVETNGITLNGTIIQKLEHAPTGDVVCSVDATGGSPSISYSNGAVTITTTTATLIKWAKLEVGSTPTIFSPRPHAEELALCQRYYQKFGTISNSKYIGFGTGFVYNSTRAFITLPLEKSLRTSTTFIKTGNIKLLIAGQYVTISSLSQDALMTSVLRMVVDVSNDTPLTAGQGCMLSSQNDGSAHIELDAEIY